MRALAILTDGQFTHDALRHFYAATPRRNPNEAADVQAFEFLTMSMHNVSAIRTMDYIDDPYPIVRAAIISWYYAVYYGAKAMIAASSGSDPQTHALAAKIWHAEIVRNQLARAPFDLDLTDLRPQIVEQNLGILRNGNRHDLNAQPIDRAMALGAALSYLKGTAEYEQRRLEEAVRSSRDYRQAGFANFRSNAARALRDAKLQPASVNFLVQAFRYRGKANYRDAIYLSYGRDESVRLRQFVSDLAKVGEAFSLMSAHFVERRVVRNDWRLFVEDLDRYARFDLPFDLSDV